MEIIRFTAPFKPGGWEYTRIALWNRFIRSKVLLLVTLLPTVTAGYFLFTGTPSFLSVLSVVVMCYPLFSVGELLFRIRDHLNFRSPLDTAETEFTFMNNGILAERKNPDKLDLFHWDKFNCLYELKDYLILFKGDSLILVLDKRRMKDGQAADIRQYILEHLPQGRSVTYKKVWFF